MMRKLYENLPSHKNSHYFLSEGKNIYLSLVEKYPENTIENLDSILNILCCGLLCLMSEVKKECRKDFISLVKLILEKNLSNLKDAKEEI
jgi:hypothetical protein